MEQSVTKNTIKKLTVDFQAVREEKSQCETARKKLAHLYRR